jgi:hypothetical protein
MKNLFILLITISQIHLLAAQPPSPLGPPICVPATKTTGDVSVGALRGLLEVQLANTVRNINRHIDTTSGQTGLKATIAYKIISVHPVIVPSYFKTMPNSNHARVSFSVDYTISNIRWHGVPYFEKKLFQSISFYFYCNKWYAPEGGTSLFQFGSEMPVLEEPSIGEQALNVFLGGWLIDYVNGQINQSLGGTAASGTINLFNNFKCSCIGLAPGTPPLKDDAIISFGYMAYATVANPSPVKVDIKSIKRLPGSPGETLPEWEELRLEYYANYNSKQISIERMRVGDILKPESLPIDATMPGRIGRLSIIINAADKNQGDFSVNPMTGLLEFYKQQQFGKGTHTVTLLRKKWLPAQPGMPRPSPILIPAYEVTIEIVHESKGTPAVTSSLQ